MSTHPGPGTIRGLRCLTTPDGRVAAVAVDQRQALRKMLTTAGTDPSDAALRSFKVGVARAVGDITPALLVDPQYGLPAVVADSAISPRLALMVAIEESGTLPWHGGKRSVILSGWGPQQAHNASACAAKLLVYARPDHKPSFTHAVELMESVRTACRKADIPYVLEILPYQLDDEDDTTYRAEFGRHVLAVAEAGDAHTPDLLKLAWPGALGVEEPEAGGLKALAKLDSPWALLSAGAPFETFERRIATAMDDGGAVGFIAGRALWQEAVGARDLDRALRDSARVRLERLLKLVNGRGHALPLPLPPSTSGWHRA